MKYYKVSYSGTATKFNGFSALVNAESERGAVESIYGKYLDQNYFPQEDGTIKDCSGNVIATKNDNCIEYDGGYFTAEEVKDKSYTIIACDSHFKLGKGLRVVEMTDDSRFVDVDSNRDITEWANYTELDDEVFDSIEDAQKRIDEL